MSEPWSLSALDFPAIQYHNVDELTFLLMFGGFLDETNRVPCCARQFVKIILPLQ